MSTRLLRVSIDYQIPTGSIAVWDKDPERWKIIKESELSGQRIIGCVSCGKPAAKIDPYWPYMAGHNRCDSHPMEE